MGKLINKNNDLKCKIVLFCNKKRIKTLHRNRKKENIYRYWELLKNQKPPRFIREYYAKRNVRAVYELVLIFPSNRWNKQLFVKDSLGRNQEALMEDNRYRIKTIIPYWFEEVIFDYSIKKHIKYDEMMNYITKIYNIAQIFTLNNKLFVQVDDEIRLFGNKNINDAERLFELVKEDLLKANRGNFIFVKDITTYQRSQLYDILVEKGFKRSELVRHYSY